MDSNDIVWRPDPAAAARTRIARFMAKHDISTLETLQRRSVEDLEWYWDAVSRDLGWQWSTPYRAAVDLSRGIQWPSWFPGGHMNLAANCIDRHLAGPRRDEPAVISEAEDGQVRSKTLHAHDERNDAGEGDTVRVIESRPMSRTKRWRLVEVVERAR